MADALSLLRQFTIEDKEYSIENDRFVFNDLAYSKDIKTKFFDMLGQYLPEKATGNIVFHFTEGSLKQVNFNF